MCVYCTQDNLAEENMSYRELISNLEEQIGDPDEQRRLLAKARAEGLDLW